MNNSRLRVIALAGAVAIVLLALVVLFYIVVAGRDIQTTAPVILGFATPTVTTLLVFGTMQNQISNIGEKVDENSKKIDPLIADTPKVGEINHDDKHNH